MHPKLRAWSEDVGVDGSIILIWILKNGGLRMSAEFVWLGMRINGSLMGIR